MATNTRSGYVKRIAIPRQRLSRERATMLGYTYVASLV